MRIGLLTCGDPMDVRTWSGTPQHVASALRELGHEVIPIGPLRVSRPVEAVVDARQAMQFVRKGRRLRDHDNLLLRAWAREADRLLKARKPDVVLAMGSLPVTYLNTDIPITLWADATFARMIGYYPAFVGLSAGVVRSAMRAESEALERCQVLVGASDWVSESFVEDYGISREKVRTIPMGANLSHDPGCQTRGVPASELSLLSVGADWRRKGLGLVTEVVAVLRARGLMVKADIVGALPEAGHISLDGVKLHGFLRKDDERQVRLVRSLFSRADLFILPSRAECFGIVFAEAAAYALPSVASRTGGVGSAVIDGQTGLLLPVESSAKEYADAVYGLCSDGSRYQLFAASARRRFETVLNWRSACSALVSESRKLGA